MQAARSSQDRALPAAFRRILAWLAAKTSLAWQLAQATYAEFSKDHGEVLAAALAFYTMLSIAPLVIIAVAIAGVVLGEGAAREHVTQTLREAMGNNAALSIDAWVDQAQTSGGLASLLGLALLLFGASRLTTQLRTAMNQIWNVDLAAEQGFRQNVRAYIRRRLFAFTMVLASGPILLGIVASRTALEAFQHWVFGRSAFAGIAVHVLHPLLSFCIVGVLTALVFKLVPDTRIGWRSVRTGAALTSLLFNAGNYLITLYLQRAALSATYGAAASAVVVLLWLYFSAQLFIFGAEFTQIYSERFGRGLSPKEIRDEERATNFARRVGANQQR